MNFTLNNEQQEAYDLIMEGKKNVFLSGGAGVGKSTVIKKVLQHTDNTTMICAPTGIAALNVHGVTIHRLLKLTSENTLINRKPTRVPEEFYKVKRIIVDEISMCRSDLFAYLVNTISLANYDHPIQLVVVGDFCQLPPVVTKRDAEFFKNGSEFAFTTTEWKDMNFKTIILNKIIRQDNQNFARALNQIRMGNKRGIRYINQKSSKSIQTDAITLASRNLEVDLINNSYLDNLDSDSITFNAIIKGEVKKSEQPVDTLLTVYLGEQVLVTANDKNDQYTNGTTGTIIDFEHGSENIGIVIRDSSDGHIFTVYPHEWSIYDYDVSEELVEKKVNGKTLYKTVKVPDKIEIGSFTQYPLKPGYAITIHKSQGQTLSSCNVIPNGWISGLLYTALSRVEDVSQMHLNDSIKPWMVKLDPAVKKFYEKVDPSLKPKEDVWVFNGK